MSPEQERAIVERLHREYREARREYGLLKAEIDSIGRTFAVLADVLVNRPEELYEADDNPNPMLRRAGECSAKMRDLSALQRRLREQLRDVGEGVD